MVNDRAKNDGSLNELAASIASKLARNAVPLTDPQPSVPQEWGGFVERQDAKYLPTTGGRNCLARATAAPEAQC
jgi:hypothetical protein